jgi:hypothetical protein
LYLGYKGIILKKSTFNRSLFNEIVDFGELKKNSKDLQTRQLKTCPISGNTVTNNRFDHRIANAINQSPTQRIAFR